MEVYRRVIKLYDVSKKELESKEFDSEGFYLCSDSGDIFLDSPRTGKREKFGNSVIIVANENEKSISPIIGRLYYVISTNILYAYSSDGWIVVSCNTMTFYDITVSNGSYTLEDERIHKLFKAVFIPDSSVSDLATNISAICSEGKCIITLDSDYDITGKLIIN